MMVIDQSGIRKRFTAALTPSPQPQVVVKVPKGHPAAFRTAFETASDERRFLSDLEYVLVSIAAIMCCMPQKNAQSDERVKRMLLALEGFSTPYLQTRFKQEAYQVANRKSSSTELSIRSRKPRHMLSKGHFPLPAKRVRHVMRSRFLEQKRYEEALALDRKYIEQKMAEQKILEQKFFENQRHEKFMALKKHREEERAFLALAGLVPASPSLKAPAPRPGM